MPHHNISPVESQKGIIADQRCSVENQKGIIADQRCSVENQKGDIARLCTALGSASQMNIFELQ